MTATVPANTAANAAAPVDTVTLIVPGALDQDRTYVVALTAGIATATGADFLPSFTWSLVRQAEDPVTIEGDVVTVNHTPLDPTDAADLASIQGIDLLWKAHATMLAFLDGTPSITSRDDVATRALDTEDLSVNTGQDLFGGVRRGAVMISVGVFGCRQGAGVEFAGGC